MTDWTPPPPGDRREQLPDDVLALLGIEPYLSTACETGQLLTEAIYMHLEHADQLRQWADRMHARCRLNHKFTGAPCNCRCHQPRPSNHPQAQGATP